MSKVRATAGAIAAGTLLLLAAGGCSSYEAYRVRFEAPDYVVTPEYFARSPRRVAVLPFAARSLKEKNLEKAQVCRIAFYQHFSARDFEDVDLQTLDRKLLPEEKPHARGHLRQFADVVRKLDVVGLTSFLDLKTLQKRDDRDAETFRSWVRTATEDLDADAYVLGLTRGYGRLYAVAFSSIGLATHLELRSTRDDALLWSADYRARDVFLPLTIDPLSVPMALFDVWRNSFGEALDVLAFKTYRSMVRTLPAGRAAGAVWVRAERKKTRLFAQPTLWTFWPRPAVKKGARLKFLQERRGWYQCAGPDGREVWLLVRDGTLVDEAGSPLPKNDPLGGLWKTGD